MTHKLTITSATGRHALPESLLYPQDMRRKLIGAAEIPWPGERLQAIDDATDELVRLGYAWPRALDRSLAWPGLKSGS